MAHDTSTDIHLDYELARFVRRVRARSMRRLGEIHPALEYGSFLFFIAICDAPDGIRGSELAEQLGVHKSTASRAIKSLLKLDLVDRVPDPDDGRAQLLVAGDEEREKLSSYRRDNQVWLQEILSGWGADDIATFARSFARLNDAAEKIP